MSERVQVLGVPIDNISILDAMEQVKEFMNSPALNTIGIITVNVLLEAAKSESYRNLIEQLDLSLIGDKEILETVNFTFAQRRMEAEGNWFLHAFIEYIILEEKRLVLLCEKESKKEEVLRHLRNNHPDLQIVGTCLPNHGEEDDDGLVNLINGESPDAILAVLPQPFQEFFMAKNRSKLGAKVWVGAGENIFLKDTLESKLKFWEKLFEKRKLKKTISDYLKEESN